MSSNPCRRCLHLKHEHTVTVFFNFETPPGMAATVKDVPACECCAGGDFEDFFDEFRTPRNPMLESMLRMREAALGPRVLEPDVYVCGPKEAERIKRQLGFVVAGAEPITADQLEASERAHAVAQNQGTFFDEVDPYVEHVMDRLEEHFGGLPRSYAGRAPRDAIERAFVAAGGNLDDIKADPLCGQWGREAAKRENDLVWSIIAGEPEPPLFTALPSYTKQSTQPLVSTPATPELPPLWFCILVAAVAIGGAVAGLWYVMLLAFGGEGLR